MWREARANDKKIKSLMTDHRKRAEKKRDFYDKIRKDPAEFMQVHGRPVKIHVDHSVSVAAEACLVKWRGDNDNMIDRFDVRAHLDVIPTSTSNSIPISSYDETSRINFERWKSLVRHDFQGNSEEKVLQLIRLEEHRDVMNQTRTKATNTKKVEKTAAIGFSYEGSVTVSGLSQQNNSSSSESDSEVDEDIEKVELDIDKMSSSDILKLKLCAHKYCIPNDDFIKYLKEEKNEAERIRIAKEIENEKSMFAGRKSRRERKAIKEKRLLIIRSLATATTMPEKQLVPQESEESSSSESEDDHRRKGKPEFITSFGGSSDEDQSKQKKDSSYTKRKSNGYNSRRHSSLNHRSRDSRSRTDRDHGKDRSSCRHRSRSSERRRSSESKKGSKRSRSRSRERWSSRSRSKSRSRGERCSSSKDPLGGDKTSTSNEGFADKVLSNTTTSPNSQTVIEPLPPPPIKRYYRHDLAKESSDEDSTDQETTKDVDLRILSTPADSKQADKSMNKVISSESGSSRQSTSSGKGLGRIQRLLMKKTRAQIESHYRQDKLLVEKSKIEDRGRSRSRDSDSHRSPTYSSRHNDCHSYKPSRYRRSRSSSS